jgi:2,4-dienoyl-CoA reductase-like NADH-dependent reductase (Old Yellow Enzyme family)
MAAHERFKFKSPQELQDKIAALGLAIPFSENLEILGRPTKYGPFSAPNSLAIHPMEGCDGTADGRPSELTIRRYDRFAGGGAGLLWGEATAIVPEARANPRQLLMIPENLADFKQLVARIHQVAKDSMGADFRPVVFIQLTHSGRYSKPKGVREPLIAHHSVIDSKSGVTDEIPLLSDEYLDHLPEIYLSAARLAQEAGFDGVDIKACHRYLVSELLASFNREDSRYGGSFENRTRLLLTTVEKIRQALPDLLVTSRMNFYDALPYPYGWGVAQDGSLTPDLTEPLKLLGMLKSLGYPGVNVTVGNPYYQPHFGRPYDTPIKEGSLPEEHPLEGIARFLGIARQVQEAFPDLNVIGSGYSWLRQYFPYVAAGMLEQGWATMVGVGREAFAYPDFAKDILQTGQMNPKKVCIACSACTQLMYDGGQSGCIVRDAEIYLPIYKELQAKKPQKG